jgi:hypothetical protein
MKRSIIAAVMLLGTALAAQAETDVWHDVRKPWRSNAKIDNALQADVAICDREAGPQYGPPTAKYRQCMQRHHWKLGRIIATPSSPVVVHNGGGVPVDSSNDETIRRQQEMDNTQQMINNQQQFDAQQKVQRRAVQPGPAAAEPLAGIILVRM